MNKLDRLPEWTALLMVIMAIMVVTRLALTGNETAVGAIIGVVVQGTTYFLRGRVEKQ